MSTLIRITSLFAITFLGSAFGASSQDALNAQAARAEARPILNAQADQVAHAVTAAFPITGSSTPAQVALQGQILAMIDKGLKSTFNQAIEHTLSVERRSGQPISASGQALATSAANAAAKGYTEVFTNVEWRLRHAVAAGTITAAQAASAARSFIDSASALSPTYAASNLRTRDLHRLAKDFPDTDVAAGTATTVSAASSATTVSATSSASGASADRSIASAPSADTSSATTVSAGGSQTRAAVIAPSSCYSGCTVVAGQSPFACYAACNQPQH